MVGNPATKSCVGSCTSFSATRIIRIPSLKTISHQIRQHLESSDFRTSSGINSRLLTMGPPGLVVPHSYWQTAECFVKRFAPSVVKRFAPSVEMWGKPFFGTEPHIHCAIFAVACSVCLVNAFALHVSGDT